VIDLRDLYFYLSLVGVFLTLNIFTLEWLRWSGNASNANHKRWALLSGLFAANFIAANLWLAPVGWARADMTAGNVYSISEATRSYLAQIKEPLLIRGYFSSQTHPLLAPLVPRLRDLLEEYSVAGEGRVRVEFIDPGEHPKLEQEANEKFAIKPVPFQFASKYQASVVNSYFNVLIQYGDQHEVLGFRDLIEVKSQSESDLDVGLRNPEYDITQSIKKVLYAYQGSGELFGNITHPVVFRGYISEEQALPEELRALRGDLENLLEGMRETSAGKLTVELHDPQADGGALAQTLKREFGFRPMTIGLFNTNSFWFYMTLQSNGQTVQIPLPSDFNKVELERSIQSGLKRFASGFLKTVALHTPVSTPPMPQLGMAAQGKRFKWLSDSLSEEHNVTPVDLKNGQVPQETDLLLLAAPEKLDNKQLFAVDQFLMQGGTVVIASSPFDVESRGALSARHHESGLGDWLKHHGIELQEQMVLDPQSAAFPIPVERRLGGFVVQETQLVDYPYFTDIRDDGMFQQGGITAGIDQVTLTWPSPIGLDGEKLANYKVTRLLESSEQSWSSESLDIQPDYQANDALGFSRGNETGRQLLAVAVEGRFDSFYKGKPSPLTVSEDVQGEDETRQATEQVVQADQTEQAAQADQTEQAAQAEQAEQAADIEKISRVIDSSPESSRIILFASNTFLSDEMLDLASAGLGTRYLNPVELVENSVDWSLEERGLLQIRGRAQFSRTLYPLDQESQVFWEYLNYGLAMIGLVLVWLVRRQLRYKTQQHYAAVLSQGV
jgi:ABC-2 type transport system permease protein